jgi:signal transduction histidine kinase
MSRLIGDLLTLARSGAADGSIPMEFFDLDDPVDAILPRARAQAPMREVGIETVPSAKVVALFGNLKIVERVLTILIDNAIRYTSHGGMIWISTWADHDRCGFIVRDNGIGIALEDQERIFERFFRVDAARTPRDGGSGLGLSIAKSMMEMHGGTIRVESDLGCGTSFRVEFPRAEIGLPVPESQIAS